MREVDFLKLQAMPLTELQELHRNLFSNELVPNNQKLLIRKIAVKLQETSLGGLSSDLTVKINELITAYDPLNRYSFRAKKLPSPGKTGRDIRLPMPGSYITKNYKGRRVEVKVLEDGFEFDGKFYKTLSTIANAITGVHWNGFAFFGVKNYGKKP